MKKYWSVILGATSLLALCALGFVLIITLSKTEKPIRNANELYNEAVSSINPTTIEYCVSLQKETKIQEESYIESSQTTVNLRNDNGNRLFAFTEEIYKFGQQTTVITEQYEDGKLYITLNNGAFETDIEPAIFLQRVIPAVTLDPNNYSSVTGFKTRDGYKVIFSLAKAPEQWLRETNIIMESADGIAFISRDGTLKELSYTISYRSGNRQINATVNTEIYSSSPHIPKILQQVQYVQISDPDIPKLLERACGSILSSATTTSHYSDHILCEAFGDDQQKNIRIDIDNRNNFSSKVETQVNIANSGKIGADTTIRKKEEFTNGKYTISINGSEQSEADTVSESKMRTVCQDILVSTIILPEYIKECNASQKDGIAEITFIPSDSLIDLLRTDALTKLYADANVLDKQADGYQTNQCNFYISIDLHKGLPVSTGFHYTGTYIINELPYKLEYTAQQAYQLTDN